MGGIYDQVGGGFARYSVDMLWKVPHFEKMLYDNGQLIELYSKAYRITNSPLYKRVVDETVQWLEREMIANRGGLYSALDADTEGQEGKFYVWSERELAETLTNDFDWASDYFEMGYLSDWEGNKVLMCSQTDEIFLNEKGWTEVFFDQELKKLKKRLLNIRSERVFPGIDDKVLTGWNAMTVKGLAHAAVIFDEPRYLDLGREIITTLLNNQWDGNQLKRNFKNGYSTIDAFLEDYAHMIDGLIALHQADLEENWINAAVSLTEKAIQEFSDEKSGMFFFTDSSSNLIARKMEINDNVIPSSNSVMAHNLFALGSLTGRMEWINRAEQMMYNVYDGMEMYGSGYSNWAMLLQRMITGQKEVVFAGNNVDEAISEFRGQIDIPVLLARVTESSTLSISQGRHSTDDLIIYVCEKGVCSLPVKSVAEAISRVIQ